MHDLELSKQGATRTDCLRQLQGSEEAQKCSTIREII